MSAHSKTPGFHVRFRQGAHGTTDLQEVWAARPRSPRSAGTRYDQIGVIARHQPVTIGTGVPVDVRAAKIQQAMGCGRETRAFPHLGQSGTPGVDPNQKLPRQVALGQLGGKWQHCLRFGGSAQAEPFGHAAGRDNSAGTYKYKRAHQCRINSSCHILPAPLPVVAPAIAVVADSGNLPPCVPPVRRTASPDRRCITGATVTDYLLCRHSADPS